MIGKFPCSLPVIAPFTPPFFNYHIAKTAILYLGEEPYTLGLFDTAG